MKSDKNYVCLKSFISYGPCFPCFCPPNNLFRELGFSRILFESPFSGQICTFLIVHLHRKRYGSVKLYIWRHYYYMCQKSAVWNSILIFYSVNRHDTDEIVLWSDVVNISLGIYLKLFDVTFWNYFPKNTSIKTVHTPVKGFILKQYVELYQDRWGYRERAIAKLALSNILMGTKAKLKGTWQRGGFSGVFAEIGSA